MLPGSPCLLSTEAEVEKGCDPIATQQPSAMNGIHGFLGACLLSAALLLPHVHPAPVIGGMLLAALIRLGFEYLRRRRDTDRNTPRASGTTSSP